MKKAIGMLLLGLSTFATQSYAGDGLQFNATIKNNCSSALVYVGHDFEYGRWNGLEPYNNPIPKWRSRLAFKASGRSDSASGTTGWVKYELESNRNKWVKIKFDVVWSPFKSNKMSVETSNRVSANTRYFNGSGSVETPTIEVNCY